MTSKFIYFLMIFLMPIILGNLTKVKPIVVTPLRIPVIKPTFKYKSLIDSVNKVEVQMDSITFETELKLIILKSQQDYLTTIKNK